MGVLDENIAYNSCNNQTPLKALSEFSQSSSRHFFNVLNNNLGDSGHKDMISLDLEGTIGIDVNQDNINEYKQFIECRKPQMEIPNPIENSLGKSHNVRIFPQMESRITADIPDEYSLLDPDAIELIKGVGEKSEYFAHEASMVHKQIKGKRKESSYNRIEKSYYPSNLSERYDFPYHRHLHDDPYKAVTYSNDNVDNENKIDLEFSKIWSSVYPRRDTEEVEDSNVLSYVEVDEATLWDGVVLAIELERSVLGSKYGSCQSKIRNKMNNSKFNKDITSKIKDETKSLMSSFTDSINHEESSSVHSKSLHISKDMVDFDKDSKAKIVIDNNIMSEKSNSNFMKDENERSDSNDTNELSTHELVRRFVEKLSNDRQSWNWELVLGPNAFKGPKGKQEAINNADYDDRQSEYAIQVQRRLKMLLSHVQPSKN